MTSNTAISQGTVSLEDARRVMAAGQDCARDIGQAQNIAVVDAGGNLVSHIRMDGAWIGSVGVAVGVSGGDAEQDTSVAEAAAF